MSLPHREKFLPKYLIQTSPVSVWSPFLFSNTPCSCQKSLFSSLVAPKGSGRCSKPLFSWKENIQIILTVTQVHVILKTGFQGQNSAWTISQSSLVLSDDAADKKWGVSCCHSSPTHWVYALVYSLSRTRAKAVLNPSPPRWCTKALNKTLSRAAVCVKDIL